MPTGRGGASPKHLFAEIRAVLLEAWDPLGLGTARGTATEYDAIAREIHALVTSGEAGAERIAHFLEWAEAEQLGLQRRPEVALEAARAIAALVGDGRGDDD